MIDGKPHVEHVCPSCGKKRLVRCYRPIDICRQCNARLGRARKHGLSHHPVYKVWEGMMMRCGHLPGGSEKYREHYEGRGITVCEEWQLNRAAFFDWALANGWAKGLQIDRKKNHLGYSPDNCHFVTCTANNRNRRSTKLTVETVKEIKQLLTKRISAVQLGVRYAVHEQTILDIKWGRTWKEVET
jgi:hypothetical protein